MAVVVAGVGLWQWVSTSGAVDSVILASPEATWNALMELIRTSGFWQNVWVTMQEILVGWSIGVAVAIVTALVMVGSPFLRRALYPYVIVFGASPKAVLLPLIAAWFTVGLQSTMVIVFLSAYFPTFVSAFTGLSRVPEDASSLMRSLRASRAQVVRRLLIPTAAPLIFVGMKASMMLACTGAVIGEFYGAQKGLGYLINSASYALRIDYVYAAILAVSIVSLLLYVLVEVAERLVIRWPAASS